MPQAIPPEADPRPEPPYPFEQEMDARRRRTPGESKIAARTLLTRLRVPAEVTRAVEEARGDAWRTLVDYGMQVPVCIAWYQRQVRVKYRQQIIFTLLLGAILAATIAALVYLAFRAPAEKSPVIVAQLGLLLSGLLGAAKVVAGTIDFQKHRSGFWEAAAKLKENLYTLEGAYRGKACVDAAIDPAFVDAVRTGTREARKIIAAEQREFFDALASPTRVLELFHSAQDDTRAAMLEIRTARAAAVTELNAATAEAERRDRGVRLRAARLAKLDAEEELRRLKAAPAELAAAGPERERALQARIDQATHELRRLELLQDGPPA